MRPATEKGKQQTDDSDRPLHGGHHPDAQRRPKSQRAKVNGKKTQSRSSDQRKGSSHLPKTSAAYKPVAPQQLQVALQNQQGGEPKGLGRVEERNPKQVWR
jgi:hypothetical protein